MIPAKDLALYYAYEENKNKVKNLVGVLDPSNRTKKAFQKLLLHPMDPEDPTAKRPKIGNRIQMDNGMGLWEGDIISAIEENKKVYMYLANSIYTNENGTNNYSDEYTKVDVTGKFIQYFYE